MFADVLTFLAEVTVLISTITAATLAVINAIKAPQRSAETQDCISNLGHQFNGRLDELLRTTRTAAYNSGLADGLRQNLDTQRPAPPADPTPLERTAGWHAGLAEGLRQNLDAQRQTQELYRAEE